MCFSKSDMWRVHQPGCAIVHLLIAPSLIALMCIAAGWLKRRLRQASMEEVQVLEVTGNSSAKHKEGVLEKYEMTPGHKSMGKLHKSIAAFK